MKKSFDAVVFDVLKVTPEEYAVSLPPLLSQVFAHNLRSGAVKLEFVGSTEEIVERDGERELGMGINRESSLVMERTEG